MISCRLVCHLNGSLHVFSFCLIVMLPLGSLFYIWNTPNLLFFLFLSHLLLVFIGVAANVLLKFESHNKIYEDVSCKWSFQKSCYWKILFSYLVWLVISFSSASLASSSLFSLYKMKKIYFHICLPFWLHLIFSWLFFDRYAWPLRSFMTLVWGDCVSHLVIDHKLHMEVIIIIT